MASAHSRKVPQWQVLLLPLLALALGDLSLRCSAAFSNLLNVRVPKGLLKLRDGRCACGRVRYPCFGFQGDKKPSCCATGFDTKTCRLPGRSATWPKDMEARSRR
ncbi:unnamed protein product [Effrenium voratum]|nr:unnamed protein product [Effrenium voratum]